jgi:hypothetical protein
VIESADERIVRQQARHRLLGVGLHQRVGERADDVRPRLARWLRRLRGQRELRRLCRLRRRTRR